MPWVSSSMRIGEPGRGRLGHRAVGGELGLALAGTTLALERLVHVRGGVLDRPDVRVVVGQVVQLLQDPDGDGQVAGVDAERVVFGRGHPTIVGRWCPLVRVSTAQSRSAECCSTSSSTGFRMTS